MPQHRSTAPLPLVALVWSIALAATPAVAAVATRPAKVPVALAEVERINLPPERGRHVEALLRRALLATKTLALVSHKAERCPLREASCLAKLRTSLHAELLVVLRVGQLADTTLLRVTVYSLARQARQGSWQEVLRGSPTDAQLSAALGRIVGSFAPRPPEKPRGRPWYTRWWVWTAAGALVAGGVTAAVLATRASGADPDIRVYPPPKR